MLQQELDRLVEELYGNGFVKQDHQWVKLAREAYKAKEYARRYAELEKKLMAQLVEISQHKETYAGGFKLEQVTRAGSVDYKRIPELQQIDIEAYRKAPSSYWVLKTALTEAIDTMGVL